MVGLLKKSSKLKFFRQVELQQVTRTKTIISSNWHVLMLLFKLVPFKPGYPKTQCKFFYFELLSCHDQMRMYRGIEVRGQGWPYFWEKTPGKSDYWIKLAKEHTGCTLTFPLVYWSFLFPSKSLQSLSY